MVTRNEPINNGYFYFVEPNKTESKSGHTRALSGSLPRRHCFRRSCPFFLFIFISCVWRCPLPLNSDFTLASFLAIFETSISFSLLCFSSQTICFSSHSICCRFSSQSVCYVNECSSLFFKQPFRHQQYPTLTVDRQPSSSFASGSIPPRRSSPAIPPRRPSNTSQSYDDFDFDDGPSYLSRFGPSWLSESQAKSTPFIIKFTRLPSNSHQYLKSLLILICLILIQLNPFLCVIILKIPESFRFHQIPILTICLVPLVPFIQMQSIPIQTSLYSILAGLKFMSFREEGRSYR